MAWLVLAQAEVAEQTQPVVVADEEAEGRALRMKERMSNSNIEAITFASNSYLLHGPN